jgi:serine protease Do
MSLAAIILAGSTIAQTPAPKPKKETREEIVIRKKGSNNEKTTIEIEGEKVIVNGKPLSEYKGDDITIMKMDRPGNIVMAPGARGFSGSPDVRLREFRNLSPAMAGNKAMLGVTTEKTDEGAKITNVTEGSGAEKAGLKKEDVITSVGDKQISGPEDLVAAIAKHKPADKVDITYNRGGKKNKTSATLSQNKSNAYAFTIPDGNFEFNMPRSFSPSLEGSMFNWNRKPKIGLQIQDLEEGKGVKVKEVDDSSPASKSGFKEGDVITSINGKIIEGVDEVRKEIADLKEGDSIKVNYIRDGKSQEADIKIPKRLKTADL